MTREYASAANNQHLQVVERSGEASGIWGVFSFDAEKQRLVLRQFTPDGRAALLSLDPSASNDSQLVFDGAEGAPRLRIRYERTGWNEFVEWIEESDVGGNYSVLTETHFKRKD